MKKISVVIALICINAITLAQSWSLTGNAGTNPATNFLGTTDNRGTSYPVIPTKEGSDCST